MSKKVKKVVPILVLFILIFPVLIFAADSNSGQPNESKIIPCTNDCDFEDLLKLVDNVINWIIMISTPLAAGVFAWAGIKYMTTGVVDQKREAHEMMRKVFIGFVFILAAWIIVNTILDALLRSDLRDAIIM